MKTILVVDDEPRIRQLYRDALEMEGYRVLAADGADRAIELLQSDPVDLAILDIRMPGVHGLELLGRVHALHPQLPVVLCSAVDSLFDDYAVWEAREQVVGAFAKPADLDALVACLSRALGASSPSR